MRNILTIILVFCFSLSTLAQTAMGGCGGVNSTLTQCGGTFADPGGTGNYANSANCIQTICSNVAGQCVTLQITSLNLENNFDFLYVYNGNSIASPLIATITNTFTGNLTSTTGCLTLRFTSDASVASTGWLGNVICHPCGSPPPPPAGPVVASDCSGAVNICTNQSFQVDPSGSGLVTEFVSGTVSNPSLNPASTNSGCLLSGELNSTWMVVNIATSGTLEFSIGTPGNGCLDWIMWPYTGPATCTQIINNQIAPIRCNWNANCNNFTGMATPLPAGGMAGDFEPELNVTCGQKFLICLSNYSSQTTSLPLNFFGTSTISCNTFTPITVNSATICPGQSATLTATGGNTYTWSPATGLSSTSGATVTATPSVTTTYTVTGTGACGSGTATSTVTVLAANNPACVTTCPATATNTGPYCVGGTIQLNGTGGGTYSWVGPNGFSSNLQNPTIPSATAAAAGTYTLTINLNGCTSTATTTVVVNPVATVNANIDQSVCAGGTVTLAGTFGGAATSASWSAPSGNFSNTALMSSTYTPTITNGTVTLTLTTNDPVGPCPFVTDQLVITVSPPATVNANLDQPVCAGGTVTLAGSFGGGATSASWSAPSGNFSNTSLMTATYTPTIANGTVTLTLTTNDPVGPCPFVTDQMIITVNPQTTPTFNQVPAICSGGTFTLPASSTNAPAIIGVWSPVNNTTTTTTYTFTPNAGQCATTTTMTVTVNQPVTPTFTQISPICSGGAIALLGTSTNLPAITGSWSPAINNTATTTYTFTPTAGQCASTTTMTVVVNQPVTPTFNQIAQICVGGSFSLPVSSTNVPAITGSWSPAVNNTTTTTYTFTPSAGQCANSTTMTVSVGPPLTPTFTQIAPICSGASLSLPTSSTNVPQITGTWSPAANNTATTTYTFTPTAGQCANTTTMTVTVNQPVQATFNPIAAICAGGAINLPATSTNNFTGTWAPVVNNQQTTTYTFTPAANQCATGNTLTVTVNAATQATFNPIAAICAGGAINLPATSTNNFTGTWSPAVNNQQTTTYTFTPTAGQCAASNTLTVTVNQPIQAAFNPIAAICAGGVINLPATSTNNFTGTWAPAVNNQQTTTYTFTPTAGQCAASNTLTVTVNQPVQAAFNPIAAICTGGAINLPATSTNNFTGSWSPAVNNTSTTTYTFTPTANQCATSNTLTVAVNQPVQATFNPIAAICAGGAINLPASSTNNFSGTWSPAVNNQQTTTYTFTPGATQCATSNTLTVTVNQPVLATFNPISAICAGGVIVLPSNSINGISGTWSPAVNTLATTTYTFTPSVGQCASGTTTSVTVNPLPPVSGTDQSICIGEQVTLVGSGAATYSWSGGIQDGIAFSPNATTTYTVTGTSAQGCVATDQVTVTVNPLPVVIAGADVSVCENETVTLIASGANTYSWTNNVVNGVSFIPSSGVTTYSVTGTSSQGCTDTDDLTVTTFSSIPVDFTPDITQGCAPLTVTFTNLTNGGTQCLWTFGDGSSSTDCGNVTHTYPSAGCFDVTLTVTTANGCVGEIAYNNLICVEANPDAYFIPSSAEESTTNPVFFFNNTSTGATTYFWDFGDNAGISDAFEPTYTYSDEFAGSYLVTLVATSDFGCVDTAQGYVSVYEDLIFYVPNTFTPDGDMYNQSFKPVFTSGFDPYDYQLMIFNRWGELIFESFNHLIGWDGTYGINTDNGFCQDGTYTYVIEFKISKNDSRRRVVGSVNIIR
jgi:gliding motility-associated-like protein